MTLIVLGWLAIILAVISIIALALNKGSSVLNIIMAVVLLIIGLAVIVGG